MVLETIGAIKLGEGERSKINWSIHNLTFFYMHTVDICNSLEAAFQPS